ncbi:MAG TPA: DUF1565 domain-containing protein, partial [Trichocoleus sp.]
MASRSSLVLTALLMGVFTGAAAPGYAQTETAPPTQVPRAGSGAAQATPQYTLIHVNAVAGSDTTGNGTQMQPLKTISRALQNATPGTVIVLAAGEYSAATGETFPLQLRPGVTIQGAPGPNRGGVVIRGGGTYMSPSQGLENVAVLAADRAGLGNVVVTNPNAQGHGVWVEAGSPILQDNVFAASGQAGVYIAGPGAATIQRNYFTGNGVAGLVISGASQTAVLGNVFENTGIGIQVAPGAAPRIQENRIVQNQDGLILQANARPVLENNTIARNRRNGLVEFQSLGQSELLSATPPQQSVPEAFSGGAIASSASPASPALLSAEPPVAARPTSLPNSENAGPIAVLPPTQSPAQTPLLPAAETPAAETPAVELRATEPPVEPSGAQSPPAEASVIAVAPPASPTLAAEPVAQSSAAAVSPSSGSEQALEADSAEVASGSADAIREAPPEVQTVVPTVTPAAAAPPEAPSETMIPEAPSENAVEPSAPSTTATSSNLAALRQRLRDQQALSNPATGGPDASGAVDLAVIPPPATAAPAVPASRPSGNLAALRERLRQQPTGATATPASESVPLDVTPPSVDTVARATSGLPAPAAALPVIPAAESLPASPSPEVPTLPLLDGSLLQVPGPDIPMGSGGSLPNVLLSQGGSQSGPPAPPSRSATLGLHYKVLVPAVDGATQDRVRAVVPDAFRVRVNGEVMMQAGAFPDQATA